MIHFAPEWINAPNSLYTTVRRGYHWEWEERPPPLKLPTHTQRQSHLTDLIKDWVIQGVVYPVPNQLCYLSRIFTVPKKDESLRLIIDLSGLNE